MTRPDVLILTALQDELEAVLALGEGGRGGWREERDRPGFRYHLREIPGEHGEPLRVAAAWIGEMGETAAAARAQQLIDELGPECLAMCGICAGYRKEVALGDVIVADRVYSYDHGKVVAGADGDILWQDITTYNLEATWRHDAAYFARELSAGAAPLAAARPIAKAEQRRWLLHALYAHEVEGAPSPMADAEQRRARCPAWNEVIRGLRGDGLLVPERSRLALTAEGRALVEGDRIEHPDGAPEAPPLRVHVGPIATGKAVREDPGLFERLRRSVRKTLGVEMEGAAIGHVAEREGIRSIVVKAVSDHADHEKDDSFRAFACRASAEVLLGFLRRQVVPRAEEEAEEGSEDELDEGIEEERRGGRRRHPFDRGRRGGGREDFLAQVEAVCRLSRREGGRVVDVRRFRAPPPFGAYLHVELQHDGGFARIYPIAAVQQPVTEEILRAFCETIDRRYRLTNPELVSTLVYGGEAPAAGVPEAAHRARVRLVSFAEYQGLLDFGDYLKHLDRRLGADVEYLPALYVDQRARIEGGPAGEEDVDNAAEALVRILDNPNGRFVLVLADFGIGKTFLMRRTAQLLLRDRRLTPVLVEMRALEKSHDLDALLSNHLARSGMERIDLPALRYMLREGRIALLFDGYDELALRVTYDRAVEHLGTLIGAAEGDAKVVVSCRAQHFGSDAQVSGALAERSKHLPGRRIVRLLPFEAEQKQRYLENRLRVEAVEAGRPIGDVAGQAAARMALLDEVKDLLGLADNPRMLSFIAGLPEAELRQAAASGGPVTEAVLYERLIGRWFKHEDERANPRGAVPGLTTGDRWDAVEALARHLWSTAERTVNVRELPERAARALRDLEARKLDEETAAHQIGSSTLLVRDEAGNFGFFHESVLEWLAARAAARDVHSAGDSEVLGQRALSMLAVRFFAALARKEEAAGWARQALEGKARGERKVNALRVLRHLGLRAGAGRDLRGQDLRGRDLTGEDLADADLSGADLSGATLAEVNLAGARLVGAKLRRANLKGALLEGVDLSEADLSWANLLEADLTGARVRGARFFAAKLLGARLPRLGEEQALGAAREVGGRAPMWTAHSPVYSVAFSPTEDILAVGDKSGTITIWDAVAGAALRVREGGIGPVYSIAWRTDGRALAFSEYDTVRLWNAYTGEDLGMLAGHAEWILSIAWNADGQILAAGSVDNSVRLWYAHTGQEFAVLQGHAGAVWSVAWSADGETLASGSSDNTVRLWCARTGNELAVLQGHGGAILSVDWSTDGETLAASSSKNAVRLWHARTGKELDMLQGQNTHDAIRSVAWSTDGQRLASGSSDTSVRLWKTRMSNEPAVLKGHVGQISSVEWSTGDQVLASGSNDGTVRLWQTTGGKEMGVLQGQARKISSLAWSTDGQTLALGSYDRTVRLWQPRTGKQLGVLQGHAGAVKSVAWSTDGQTLASGSYDATVRLWQAHTGKELGVLHGQVPMRAIFSVAWNTDSKILASGSYDRTVRLWQAHTGKDLGVLQGHAGAVLSLAWSADGQTLASGASDGNVRLWQAHTGKYLGVLNGHAGRVIALAWSADGQSVASGSSDMNVRVWNSQAIDLSVLQGHAGEVLSLAWSASGETLASGSEDKTVRLWEPRTGKALAVLRGHACSVNAVTFDPTGHTLASASDDGTIRLWDIPTQRCLAILLPLPEGWVAFTPDGRYKYGGNLAGGFWHAIGLCRFEPGELDPYVPGLRLAEDEPLVPAIPPAPPITG